MAAREHQGMQIALIIFVVLTISLIVTSYWFFDQFKNEQKKFQGEAKRTRSPTPTRRWPSRTSRRSSA